MNASPGNRNYDHEVLRLFNGGSCSGNTSSLGRKGDTCFLEHFLIDMFFRRLREWKPRFLHNRVIVFLKASVKLLILQTSSQLDSDKHLCSETTQLHFEVVSIHVNLSTSLQSKTSICSIKDIPRYV